MSRKDAHVFAASLAATLMVSIVVFQAGDGTCFLGHVVMLVIKGTTQTYAPACVNPEACV